MTTVSVRTQALPGQRKPVPGWLYVRPRLVFGGLAVALLLAATTFGRPWLEALGIGSAILSLAPCAAMCAAGICMKGGGGCAKQGETNASAAAEIPSVPRISPST
jgi:hypothetical protein